MMTISTLGFLKYLTGDKGITITQLQDYKNTATNWTQELRMPFKKTQVYDRTFKPQGWSTVEHVPAFIPSILTLDETIALEGKLNAFNEFATKVMESHQAEKQRIAQMPWTDIVEVTDFVHESDARILEIHDLVVKLDLVRPERKYADRPEQKNTVVEIFDFLDEKEVYDYLLANQTASALGNLILSQPENSRDPRNFLYQIFEQEYVSFVKADTLYSPNLKGADLKAYQDRFFSIQSAHREQEKKRNLYKSRYDAYVQKTKMADLEDYKMRYQAFQFEDKIVDNDYQSAFTEWSDKRKALTDEFNNLNTGRNAEAISFKDNLQTQAETIRKETESEFYNRRVWLPEEARKTVDLIKAKRGE